MSTASEHSDLFNPAAVVKTLWQVAVGWGVAALVLGILMLVWPGATLVVAAALFGVYMVVSGLFSLVAAFAAGEGFGTRALLFISGALSLILGILAFRHFGQGIALFLLAIWIGVAFIFQGVAEIGIGIEYKWLPDRGWTIFSGVLAVLAGIVLLAYPFSSIVALTLVTGIWLIVIGVVQIVKAFRLRRGVRNVEMRNVEKRISSAVNGH